MRTVHARSSGGARLPAPPVRTARKSCVRLGFFRPLGSRQPRTKAAPAWGDAGLDAPRSASSGSCRNSRDRCSPGYGCRFGLGQRLAFHLDAAGKFQPPAVPVVGLREILELVLADGGEQFQFPGPQIADGHCEPGGGKFVAFSPRFCVIPGRRLPFGHAEGRQNRGGHGASVAPASAAMMPSRESKEYAGTHANWRFDPGNYLN